jgi:hypothetical protein
MQSLLSGTRQLDALRHARVWFTFALMCSGVSLLDRAGGEPGVIAVCASVAFFLFVAAGLAVVYRIHCPECRTRWFFHAVRSQPTGRWLPWLKSFSACPRCGFSRGDCADSETPSGSGVPFL